MSNNRGIVGNIEPALKEAKTNPLALLKDLGQSIWLDDMRRDFITSGLLRRLIEKDGLTGMTSNPAIFEKAITSTASYDSDIRDMAFHGRTPIDIYETLSQTDVQRAADEFRPVYDTSDAQDGYVSLEVNPHLAYDTKGTIVEARRLWRTLNRPNVFIKVPATDEGLPAIRKLISEGINTNITLLFGLPRYRQVIDAWLGGLEERVRGGKSVNRIASVASFFVSRIDSLVDPMLEKHVARQDTNAEFTARIVGHVAISSGILAYQIYTQMIDSQRFKQLQRNGAQMQRLLWASTSTKNPAYSKLKYVEALIGANTINTVPLETLNIYREHGRPKARLKSNVADANWVFQGLPRLGLHIDDVTKQLEHEGVEKFQESFDRLIVALKSKHRDRDLENVRETT